MMRDISSKTSHQEKINKMNNQLVLHTESAANLATAWLENMKRTTTQENILAFEYAREIQQKAIQTLRERPSGYIALHFISLV
jgi:hypothetical protein